MTRHLIITTVLIALPAIAFAQRLPRLRRMLGEGDSAGGMRSAGPLLPNVSPLMPNISPAMPNISPVTTGLGGGFTRTNPWKAGFPIWGGGGWFPYYGYGAPYYPTPMVVEVPVPVPVQVQPPQPPLPISGESHAILVLAFPTEAEVWVNGKKGEGDPDSTWTLTSPSLRTGTEYVFDVKARWKVNGKTYEYDRKVTVEAGNRSKATILTGTEIKE